MAKAPRERLENESAGQRDRSPSYPFIPLQTAVERLEAFENYFKRHPAPVKKAGLAWGVKEKGSQSDQTLAALRSFGLIEYQGAPEHREAIISEDGRTYLRAQQESTKQEVLKRAALRPKQIRKFWEKWKSDRPPDAVCLDELTLKNGFSDRGARSFLKVYDATIAYAGLSSSDKIPAENGEREGDEAGGNDDPPPLLPPANRENKLMAGERIVFTEEGQPNQYLKLIASGDMDAGLLEALEDFVKRQRKRLGLPDAAPGKKYKVI